MAYWRSTRFFSTKYSVLSTRCVAALAIAVALLTQPRTVAAQTLLRWKLKPGDALTVEIEQHTDSLVAFSAKSAKTTIELKLKLAWKVTAAGDNGFTIRQNVAWIYEKLVTPDMETIEYDSAPDTRPS